MNVKMFLMENAEEKKEECINISERFVNDEGDIIPFEIKSINEAEAREIQESSVKQTVAGGKKINILDYEKYNAKLIAECTKTPNFMDTELQKNWGANNAEELVRKMLSSGEYKKLENAVLKICGFMSLSELAAQVKNA